MVNQAKWHGINLNDYNLVKEDNLKRVHDVEFQLYNIWGQENYGDSKKVNGC